MEPHPQFLAKLFFQEVPEIYEGVIEIKSVARDPGSRAKICVFSKESSIDPVGACVGMRGSRVQTIVNELHGEKIDIIKWTEDLPTLIAESLSPAEIQKVLIDKDNNRIDVILTEENLSKAIGRRGQNVRLASKLTNFEIDILTDKEDSERSQAEFKERTENLVKSLEVDETLGQLLVSEGMQSPHRCQCDCHPSENSFLRPSYFRDGWQTRHWMMMALFPRRRCSLFSGASSHRYFHRRQ